MSDITGQKIINKIHVGTTDYQLNADYLGGLSSAEWKSLVGAGFNVLVVESLPTASESTQKGIYLIADAHGNGDSYDEYVTVKSGNAYSWEKIGNTDIDISKLAEELVVSGTELTTESAGEQVATGSATVSYMKSAEATGSAGAGVEANTGEAGGATINGSSFGFSGTENTITLSGTLPTLSQVSFTPAGTISGKVDVGNHTHSITPTTEELTYVSGTASATGEVEGHTHTVSLTTASATYVSDVDASTGEAVAHTHTITASKVTGWNEGSTSLSEKNFGFSASTSDIMSAPTVSTDGVLSWTTVNAASQDVLSFTAPSLIYTDGTITAGGAHSHTIGKATNSLTYASAVKNVSTAGGHSHSIGAPTTASLSVVTGVSVTGSAGSHTINGSSFKFNGNALTFTPALSTNALSVSGKFTPAGSITGSVTLPSHSHSYTAPSAHTHSITLTSTQVTGSASVAVSSHTHSIAAHTHTISKKTSG